MAVEGRALVRAFDARGWGWGGRWSGTMDYQHFSAERALAGPCPRCRCTCARRRRLWRRGFDRIRAELRIPEAFPRGGRGRGARGGRGRPPGPARTAATSP